MHCKQTDELNLSIFNMIIGMNELKTLTKHISYHANVDVNLMVENVI